MENSNSILSSIDLERNERFKFDSFLQVYSKNFFRRICILFFFSSLEKDPSPLSDSFLKSSRHQWRGGSNLSGGRERIVARFFSSIIRIKFRTAHNPPEIPPPPWNHLEGALSRILNRQGRGRVKENPSQILPFFAPPFFVSLSLSLSPFCPPRVDSRRITFQRRNVRRILACGCYRILRGIWFSSK